MAVQLGGRLRVTSIPSKGFADLIPTFRAQAAIRESPSARGVWLPRPKTLAALL